MWSQLLKQAFSPFPILEDNSWLCCRINFHKASNNIKSRRRSGEPLKRPSCTLRWVKPLHSSLSCLLPPGHNVGALGCLSAHPRLFILAHGFAWPHELPSPIRSLRPIVASTLHLMETGKEEGMPPSGRAWPGGPCSVLHPPVGKMLIKGHTQVQGRPASLLSKCPDFCPTLLKLTPVFES